MRGRLSLLVLAVTSMVVISFLVPLALLVRSQAESRALDDGQRTARSVAAGLAVAASLSGGLDRAVVDLVIATSGGARTSVFLPDGTVAGAPADRSAAVDLAAAGRALTAATDGGVEVLVPVTATGDTVVVRSFVGEDDLSEGVLAATLSLAGLGVVLIAAAVVLADRLGRTLVRPVSGLAATARQMAAGDLSARAGTDGPSEVADLGRAFNQLADRIGDLIVEERESLADLSHSLRTPLTALRLQAEMTPGPEAAAMLDDIDRLSARVDGLIEEARRRSPAAGPRRADLASVTGERFAFWSVLADEQGRSHRAEIPDRPVEVAATEEELAAAIDTILENVFAHTPAGTAYRLSVAALPDGGMLVYEDEGPGFPSTEVVRRGTSHAGSTGLGLDIVRRTAERSGGRIEVGASPAGGARLTVRFGTAGPG